MIFSCARGAPGIRPKGTLTRGPLKPNVSGILVNANIQVTNQRLPDSPVPHNAKPPLAGITNEQRD